MNDKKKIKERKSTIDGNTAIVVNKLKEIGFKILIIAQIYRGLNILFNPYTEIQPSGFDVVLVIFLIIIVIEKLYPIKTMKKLKRWSFLLLSVAVIYKELSKFPILIIHLLFLEKYSIFSNFSNSSHPHINLFDIFLMLYLLVLLIDFMMDVSKSNE